MAKYLVIVESPAKVKTIKKFLGSNYEVMASQGHVRDLPKSDMGIDVENNYEPKYITIRGKGEILAALRKEVKKAEKIYLATDPDREGEAISWHLYHALKLVGKKTYRISFNEITKNAVKESLKNAREIEMDLVDAQQARRVLDRMVGYRISPLLWAKVKRGLSAGRVQSVALRIICDREAQIEAFIPEEYWSLDAVLNVKGEKKPLVAAYYGTIEGKKELQSRADVDAVLKAVKGKQFRVHEIKKGERSRKAPLPFTTSTLQQEAGKVLNFTTQKTMSLAQQLYEGVEIKGEGTIALITYLRTDSTRVSEEAEAMAKEYILKNYDESYVGTPVERKKTGKIQDAHEAIRPTSLDMDPASLKNVLPRDLYRLYQLIYRRFLASRMQDARYETTNVKVEAGGQLFSASASKVVFDGFTAIYTQEDDEEEGKDGTLNMGLSEKSVLTVEELRDKQHFTQPPAHYTESSLVKALEELGIGRPSTYAPTITTIIKRHYIAKENKNLFVTDLGEAVNKIMVEAFPAIVNVQFTANLETLLDAVEEGNIEWKTVVSNFYPDLDEAVKIAEKDLEKVKIKDELSDEVCDKCGRQMVIKYGPHGKFLACPGFPDCQNIKNFLEKVGVSCPKCGQDVIIRKTQKGRRYFGCSGYPECDFMSWDRPSDKHCEKCGERMYVKGHKLVCGNAQCGNIVDLPEEASQNA